MFQKLLELSTAHIRPETARWIENQQMADYSSIIAYPKGPYGWFIPVINFSAFDDIPRDLLFVLAYAAGSNADWLCLDRDAEEIDSIPSYDWE